MKKSASLSSPHGKWVIFFGLWLVFLSGAFANVVGSPGVLQAFRLNNLLETKKVQLLKLQEDLHTLQTEANELTGNRIAQEREVRRTLGYAANNEIIFDFSADSL